MELKDHLFEYLTRLGDTSLILGHRLSELCSYGPTLEEDIAQTNIALDHLGQAQNLLKYAGEVEGRGRTEDELTYRRAEREFRAILMVQQPNTDFAWVIGRSLLFDVWQVLLYERLVNSKDETLSGIASKGLKEARYHLRHSIQWTLRLGDGSVESHQRMQDAIFGLWPYTGELFETDETEEALSHAGIAPEMTEIHSEWKRIVKETLEEATLEIPPADTFMHSGGRKGIHTEYMGFMVADMQYLQRAYPDATW